MTFEEKLQKYAELVVQVGLNLRKDQTLMINAPLEAAEFTRKVVKAAYDQGAFRVHVFWEDSPTSKISLQNQPEEALQDLPEWRVAMFNELVENTGAVFQITGSDPNALSGVDPSRLQMAQQAAGKRLKNYQGAMLKGDINWCIAGAPTAAWAKQVFPDKSEQEGIEALWEKIFETVRMDQADPVQAWKDHSAALHEKMNYLNEKSFKTLHYKGPGTDLHIDLHPDHQWVGAGHESPHGVYLPNMPTEEVFTAPYKYGVNGTVSSTLPLSVYGNMIENFSFTFEDGKVVDFSAEKGYETLKGMLEVDEAARYLGEVALVPDDSPISNSGIIFFNTLYDENASCHLALGNAITMNIKNGGNLSKEELEEKGANQSFIHTDFMVGSADLDIDAETHDGERIPLFRKGNWAI